MQRRQEMPTLQKSTFRQKLSKISLKKTEANVVVKTDVAEVILDQKAAEAMAEKATTGTVSIVVEKSKGGRQTGPY